MQLPRHFTDKTLLANSVETFITPQNGGLRSATRNPLERGAERLTDSYPNLQASHITLAGTAGALAVSAITKRYPESARLASWVHLVSSLTDALDGPVARIQGQRNGTTSYLAGSLIDTSSDRIQEFAAGLAQSQIAFARGNSFGGYTQLAFAATSILPSLSRSLAESKGIVVAEGALGSRHSRVTLNCLGYFWNKHPNRVAALGVLGTGLNLYNTTQRLAALREGSPNNLGSLQPEKQQDAKTRHAMLSVMAIASTAIAYKAARLARNG